MRAEQPQPTQSIFRKFNRGLGKVVNTFEVGSLIFCVGALAVLLIANVVARTFFKSIYFAEEISEFLVIFITFAGTSYGVRKARHIRMGAFLDMMPSKMEKIFILVIAAVSAAVMFIMAYSSYDYMMNSLSRGHMTPALRLPYWIFYVILPVGFFMAGLQYIRTIIRNLTHQETWMSPEQQSEYEDEAIGEA